MPVFSESPRLVKATDEDGNLGGIHVNENVYIEFIQYLYTPKSFLTKQLCFEEVRYLTIFGSTENLLKKGALRNAQLWLMPMPCVAIMARIVSCNLFYYLTAGFHHACMMDMSRWNFLIIRSNGHAQYNFGPAAKTLSIHDDFAHMKEHMMKIVTKPAKRQTASTSRATKRPKVNS